MTNQSTLEPYYEILSHAFVRKQESREGYTLGNLALELDLSKPYISRVLGGKKKPSAKFLREASLVLNLTPDERRLIYLSLCYESLPTQQCQKYFLEELGQRSESHTADSFMLLEQDSFSILRYWQTTAILQLIAIEGFREDISWIAKRLNTTTGEISEALALLFHHKFLTTKDDKWSKKDKRIKISEDVPQALFTNYQKQMVERQMVELESNIDNRENRYMTSLTVSTSPEHVQELKIFLDKAVIEFFELLETNEPSEVYQLNLGLIPLSRQD